jgi:hypothetical protein
VLSAGCRTGTLPRAGCSSVVGGRVGKWSVRRQRQSAAWRPAAEWRSAAGRAGRAVRLAGAEPVVASRWRGAGRRVSLARSRSSRLAGAEPVVASRWRGAGRRVSLARSRSPRLAGAEPVAASRWRGAGRRVSLARSRIRRPSPRLVQIPESRPTSGGPAAVVSLRHGRHLRAEGCHLPEGSRLPNYPPEHHAPEGPGFCGQLLTQLPVCSLSGCSGSCTRWGYLDSGPTCRPVRVFPGGHARECFPSLLSARSTARTLPLRGHRCRYPKQHRCHRILPCFLVRPTQLEVAARHPHRPLRRIDARFPSGKPAQVAESRRKRRPPPGYGTSSASRRRLTAKLAHCQVLRSITPCRRLMDQDPARTRRMHWFAHRDASCSQRRERRMLAARAVRSYPAEADRR